MKTISDYFYKIAKNELFKLNRSLTGKDTYKTLKILKREIPNLKIKFFKSGTKIYDWKIPAEWNVKSAYVEDRYKNKIINFKSNNLHLVSYSEPFEGVLNKNQLLKKINSLRKYKDAIPYVTSYYVKSWGFCTTEKFKNKLKKSYKNKDLFKVKVNSTFNKKGKMHYGELIIKGKSKQEIFLTTYICHPSMANNELSGPILLMSLIKYFSKRKNNKTLRFIFIPETIGALSYLGKNFLELKRNVISGLNLTCVGDEGNFSYIKSKYNNTVTEKILNQMNKRKKIYMKKYSFLQRGSNERQFTSPFVDLPLITICKSKFGTFKEYHNSKDDFNFVTRRGIFQSFSYFIKLIKQIDKSIIPRTLIVGEPFLQKRNLISRLNYENQKYNYKGRDILDVLQYSDGKNTLEDISKYTKISIKKIKSLIIKLKKKKLLTY